MKALMLLSVLIEKEKIKGVTGLVEKMKFRDQRKKALVKFYHKHRKEYKELCKTAQACSEMKPCFRLYGRREQLKVYLEKAMVKSRGNNAGLDQNSPRNQSRLNQVVEIGFGYIVKQIVYSKVNS